MCRTRLRLAALVPVFALTPTFCLPGAAMAQTGDATQPPPVASPTGTLGAAAPIKRPPITGIRFHGSSITDDLIAISDAYIGRAGDEPLLRQLAQDLATAYTASDIAIFSISIDGQDPRDGLLSISIVEGHVEDLVFTGGMTGKGAERVKRLAETLDKGDKPLSKAALQRALRLIGETPGVKVDAEMTAGTQPGGLLVTFALQPVKPTYGVQYNNYGTQLLGRSQVQISGQWSNLLAGGDRLDLAAGTMLSGRSRSFGAAYSVPIGTHGLQAIVSAAYQPSSIDAYALKGTAYAASVNLAYPLIANDRRSLTASIGFDGVNSDSAILGQLIVTERNRMLRARLAWSDTSARAALAAAVTVSRALPIAGARVIFPLAEKRFTKVKADMTYNRLIGSRAIARLRLMGQYSRDAVANAEGFAVGGPEMGRAFEQAILNGDRGIAGSLELGWSPFKSTGTRQIELYSFIDGASVHYNAREPLVGSGSFDLASIGAGVRIADQGLQIDLSVARALDAPFAGYGSPWRFSIGTQFSLQ
jgi:hemolysin activation/secretion protein